MKSKILGLLAIGLLCGSLPVKASIVASGNWGSDGYDVIGFSTAGGIVDMLYTGGYADPTFSLFNAGGAHLITNDDISAPPSEYSRITQNLAAGNYWLLVSYCCVSFSYASTNGATVSDTDDFNSGSYRLGGTGTLSGMQSYTSAHASQNSQYQNLDYALTISNADNASPVPLPAAVWLLLSGLGGLGFLGRRKTH